jgi:hypothetical protein
MLDWVTNLEREKKPILCPVCKAPINVDGPWDPVLALNDQIKRSFGRVSPGLLLSGFSAGVAIGLGAYGLVAVRVFAGGEGLFRYIYRWTDGTWRVNAGHVLFAPWIGPALVMGQTFPYYSNLLFIPAASLVSCHGYLAAYHFADCGLVRRHSSGPRRELSDLATVTPARLSRLSLDPATLPRATTRAIWRMGEAYEQAAFGLGRPGP